MARQRYNHNHRITDLQPAKIKSLYPGTIVKFRYSGNKVFDKTPVVLVLWNDYIEYKIHGINLNYLTEFEIKLLFKELMEVKGNTLVVEDQSEEYDDTLPYRNLLKDPYTRIKLPTYKENRGGNPLSKSQALTQMKNLYTKHLKKVIKKHDMYRSYFDNKMREPKVVTYDIEGLLK
jgi:hypothetical protein